jgi:heme/copper-type cytochrome/quinol oxidase subunit 4
MFWREEYLILSIFLVSLTDLVLCLLAFSDMARQSRQRWGSWIYWFAVCSLVPAIGPLIYFLVQRKQNA